MIFFTYFINRKCSINSRKTLIITSYLLSPTDQQQPKIYRQMSRQNKHSCAQTTFQNCTVRFAAFLELVTFSYLLTGLKFLKEKKRVCSLNMSLTVFLFNSHAPSDHNITFETSSFCWTYHRQNNFTHSLQLLYVNCALYHR